MSAKKYETLVSLYAEEIAKVKQLKAQAEAAGEAAREHMKATGEDVDEAQHYIDERQLYAAWNDAEGNYQGALVDLTENIRMEYADVPFGKAFEASVDAFFREAGLA